MNVAFASKAPVLDIDPFSDEFLNDPYPFHAAMRDAGPVVRLARYNIWALARYANVHPALADWEVWSSAAGVGIDDFRRNKPWRPPSLLLEVDPPLHTRTRQVMNRILSAKAMAGLREQFQIKAEALVDKLMERRHVDAITDIAEAYPLEVFPDAVGLRPDGRENLLPYGTMVFNSFGPRNALFEDSIREANKVVQWILDQCEREALAPGGFGANIWAAHDAGDITRDEAPVLVRSLLTAGLDTTIIGIGNGLWAFASNPDQWQVLRDDPALLRPAFDEIIRWESPVQTFFRTTTRATEIEGVGIEQDAKALMFMSSANRDPRKWDNPDTFDIRRKPFGHVAFGSGIHLCVGQMVARLESEMIFGALAKRVKRIEITGAPVRKINNTLRQLAHLPIELVPA